MIDFNNSKNAFSDKSDFDLFRAFFLFKTLNYPIISKFLTVILKVILYLRIPIDFLIKLTIFKQFCGGETISDSSKTIDKLWKSSIGTILDYSAEGQENEERCDCRLYPVSFYFGTQGRTGQSATRRNSRTGNQRPGRTKRC